MNVQNFSTETKGYAIKEMNKQDVNEVVELDLSHFSTEDAKQVQARLDYLATLNVSAETCKDLQMAMVRCLYDHKNISEFKPTYINVDNNVETCIKHVLLLKKNLAFVGPNGTGKNNMILHLASLMDLQLHDYHIDFNINA